MGERRTLHGGGICIFLFKQTGKQHLRGKSFGKGFSQYVILHLKLWVPFQHKHSCLGDGDWNRAPATVMQCDNSLEKDVFDVFSKWMFLKSEAVSDKISKDILSLPHFKPLNLECPCHGCREAPKGMILYNKLHKLHFTLQKMYLSQANSVIYPRSLSLVFPSNATPHCR